MQLPHRYLACFFLLLLSDIAAANRQDDTQPQQQQYPLQDTPVSANIINTHKVAIIGAGAGGASAAYHLSKFANSSSHDISLDITIFDINNRAGGRTTTVNAFNDPRFPVEVGASIFVKVNHILYNASREFGFNTDRVSGGTTGSYFELGVWDGRYFAFTSRQDPEGNESRWKGYWDIAKLIWRYGISPIRTNQLMKSTVGKFLTLYDDFFPFSDLTVATAAVGLDEFTGVTGTEALARAGISDEFARDVIQASTRVNYAQNLGSIHGLEAMVCMATDSAMAVEGGNWKIFDEFVKRSHAKTRYETKVDKITQSKTKGTFYITTTTNQDSEPPIDSDEQFDTIVLAAPYQFANITFQPDLPSSTLKIDYVKLHVTLFTSTYLPDPKFFGLSGQWEVPDTILTTLPFQSRVPPGSRGKDAIGPMKFWSLSTRVLHTNTGPQYLYKIFSPEPISVTFVGEMFNFDISNSITSDASDDEFVPLSFAPAELISWHHVRTWHSYPYLEPTKEFPPIILADGVYYTSGIEPFISTMETSALSGMNVARLLIDRLEGEDGVVHDMAGFRFDGEL